MSNRDRIKVPPSDYVSIHHIAEAAKRGNRRAAEALLAEFIYRADIHEQPDPELETYLADAFWSVVRFHENPGKALNLPPKRGRPERWIGISFRAARNYHCFQRADLTPRQVRTAR